MVLCNVQSINLFGRRIVPWVAAGKIASVTNAAGTIGSWGSKLNFMGGQKFHSFGISKRHFGQCNNKCVSAGDENGRAIVHPSAYYIFGVILQFSPSLGMLAHLMHIHSCIIPVCRKFIFLFAYETNSFSKWENVEFTYVYSLDSLSTGIEHCLASSCCSICDSFRVVFVSSWPVRHCAYRSEQTI